jgi:eukaryotic-like serine/threonine-protein kinase
VSSSASTALEPGSRLAGRYRLCEPIGSGGMGRVFRAHDEHLDREVAVKVLDEVGRAGDEAGRTYAREARAAAALTHPGIARIFDSGTQDGNTFVVMELVPGRTLRQLLDERRTLRPIRAAELAAHVADALDAAHRQGVVHCDVKPHNIIVTPSGMPKLVDFGIARAANATRGFGPEEIWGSAPYVSPEQVRGEPIDGRTDLYALGAVLYEMLTGRPPFVGQSLAAIVSQRLVADPPRPRSLDPSIPAELEGVVLTALARDPVGRYADGGRVRDALRDVANRQRGAARAHPIKINQCGREGRAPGGSGRLAAWVRSRRRVAATLGIVAGIVVLALLLAAALASPIRGPTPPAQQVRVPDLVGKRLSEVPPLLEQAGLAPGEVQTRPVERTRIGTVLEQQPAPGQGVAPGGSVQLVVGTSR